MLIRRQVGLEITPRAVRLAVVRRLALAMAGHESPLTSTSRGCARDGLRRGAGWPAG